MIRFFQFLLAGCLLVASGLTHADDVVVFGDSLSDQGNAASGLGAFPPPFYLGSRVSNGPVAVEVFADLLGSPLSASRHLVGEYAGNNFAVAGARARGNEPIDLKFQVGAYLLLNGGNVAADNIYVMLIGGNDVRDARGERGRNARRILRDAAEEIDQQLRLLISLGARAIMVGNSPDIGIIPESLEIAKLRGGRSVARRASRYTRYFNRDLDRKLRRIERDTEVDIVRYDLESLLDNVIEKAVARQFDNTTESCYDSSSFVFLPGCDNGDSFDRYVFFDGIHPSARTHDIAGRLMYTYTPVAPE